MSTQLDKPAPLLIHWESTNAMKESDFQSRLESKDDDQKIQALEQIIAMLVNGNITGLLDWWCTIANNISSSSVCLR
jgi:hypothetical protein